MTMEPSRRDGPQPEAPPPPGVRTMAVVRWVLVVLMGIIAAGAVFSYFANPRGRSRGAMKAGAEIYYCPMHPQIVQDHPGECPICSMTLVPRPQGAVKPSSTMAPTTGRGEETKTPAAAGTGKYHCPMHPQVTSDNPDAKCDLCGGMKLLPRPAGNGAEGPEPEGVPGLVPVDIPADRVQNIGVRTARVTRESLVNDFRTVGVVEANERALAQIAPRFSGWIEKLFVAETGQRVKRGQALATIYSPEILQAQQELLTALGWNATSSAPAHHGKAGPLEGMVADARRRLELLGISEQEIDSISKGRQPQRAIAIRSPVEGNVIAKNAVVGMSFSAGATLFEVADLSTVWVIADVYESDVHRVRLGQLARFEASAYPGETFTGKVKFVYPTLDTTSRTLRLRLELKNRPGADSVKLRPGMFGSVMLDMPATTGLMVPSEAVVDTGELQYVFVAKEHGRFEPRRVKLGARFGERFEILEGVAAGETVVTTANFLIDSESRLRAAITGRSASAPAADGAASPARPSSACDQAFDQRKYPDEHRACQACEVQHRGMGTMEEDCKKAIARPWR
jgi:Cu(I)/Ag(I) efflux system membrane fusion protein